MNTRHATCDHGLVETPGVTERQAQFLFTLVHQRTCMTVGHELSETIFNDAERMAGRPMTVSEWTCAVAALLVRRLPGADLGDSPEDVETALELVEEGNALLGIRPD